MMKSEEADVTRSLLELKDVTVSHGVHLEKGEKDIINDEEPPRLTNYWETLMHVLKSNIGSGLFAMGYAFKMSGLALGTVLVGVIGVVCVYCQHMMLRVCDDTALKLNKKYPVGFEEAAEHCFELGHPMGKKFAKHMGRTVKTFVCITQSGFCCVYIVFISTNLQQIWTQYISDINLHAMMCIVIVPMILLSWVRDMKSMAPLSIVANILILLGVASVTAVAVPNLPPISERRLVSPLYMIPLFFGTVIYTFEGIGLVTPIKSKTRNPERFASMFGPLNVGMFMLGVLIILVGFIGYLRWGDEVGDSVTLNLDPNTIIGQVVKGAICLGVLFTYPLQLQPAILILFPVAETLFGPFNRPVLAEIIVRTIYGLFLFSLAEAIPHLALFISLVGAVSSTALALVIPPLMEMTTFHEDYGRYHWRIWKNALIIVFGLFGFVTGTYYSLKEIIETFFGTADGGQAE